MAKDLNYSTEIILVAHNIRSAHNIGSLFRTAEGLGVKELILSGYTPYPKSLNDERLPHIAEKADKQISKTALGAEKSLKWHHSVDFKGGIADAKKQGYKVYALEQSPKSIEITKIAPPAKAVIILGNELTGLDNELLDLCDSIIEIPMFGKKESFNVVQAAAMALFYFSLTAVTKQ